MRTNFHRIAVAHVQDLHSKSVARISWAKRLLEKCGVTPSDKSSVTLRAESKATFHQKISLKKKFKPTFWIRFCRYREKPQFHPQKKMKANANTEVGFKIGTQCHKSDFQCSQVVFYVLKKRGQLLPPFDLVCNSTLYSAVLLTMNFSAGLFRLWQAWILMTPAVAGAHENPRLSPALTAPRNKGVVLEVKRTADSTKMNPCSYCDSYWCDRKIKCIYQQQPSKQYIQHKKKHWGITKSNVRHCLSFKLKSTRLRVLWT